jgi:hypothetical protein
MKNTMRLFIVLFFIALISNVTFAQEAGNANKKQIKKANWVDADGDGICDNVGTASQGSKKNKKVNKGDKKGKGQGLTNGNINGKGDGSGLRPQDGTGFGRKSGKGTCEETGNNASGRKGSGRKGGK